MSLRNGRSKQACFQGENRRPGIADEQTQLGEAPPRLAGSILGSNRSPAAYPLEVLEGDAVIGVFSQLDKLLADPVILVPAEPAFPARQLLEPFLGSPLSPSFAETCGCDGACAGHV